MLMIMMLTLELISTLPTFANQWATARSIFMSSQRVRLSAGDWDLWGWTRGRLLSGERRQFPIAFHPQVWRSVKGQNVWRATSWLWRVAPLLHCSSSRWSVRGKKKKSVSICTWEGEMHLVVLLWHVLVKARSPTDISGAQQVWDLEIRVGGFCFLENRAL